MPSKGAGASPAARDDVQRPSRPGKTAGPGDDLTHRGDAEHPLRRDAAENRRRVLEAASEVFAVHGLDAPIEEVAHFAGVGLGTVYRRFSNKEALIEQLVRDLLDQVLVAAREALDVVDGTGLEQFLRDTAALQERQRGCMSRMWTSPMDDAFIADLERTMTELLVRAQAAGHVRDDCAPTDLSVVFWALRGVIETAGDAAPDAWQRHLDIVLAGLRPGSAALARGPISAAQRSAVLRARRTTGGPPRDGNEQPS